MSKHANRPRDVSAYERFDFLHSVQDNLISTDNLRRHWLEEIGIEPTIVK